MTTKTHSFAQDHGKYRYQPNLNWLTSAENVPLWSTGIPEILKIKERGDDKRCVEFSEFLHTTKGAILWHLWCYTAYEYQMRGDVERIGQDKVTAELNARGNQIYENPEINTFIHDLRAEEGGENNDDWTVARGGVLVSDQVGTMFARLFNYHHCVLQNRLVLFKCSPRTLSKKHNCPVCGSVFTSNGFVCERPTKAVYPDGWTYDDKIEGGSDTHETKI